jgi:DNA-directed RNA polymerase specialized sigma24 family protein
VARARSGDPRAFRALYDLAFRLVWAWSLRTTSDPDRAEALTSITLRGSFERLGEYDGSLSFGVWLVRQARAALAPDASQKANPPPLAGSR